MENWMKMVEMYEVVAVLPQVKEWRMEEWKKKQNEEQKKKNVREKSRAGEYGCLTVGNRWRKKMKAKKGNRKIK